MHELVFKEAGTQSDSIRRWVRRSWIGATAAALIWLAGSQALGHRDIYWRGPVSHAHKIFGTRCEDCHTQSFNQVNDAACLTCHEGLLTERQLAARLGVETLGELGQSHRDDIRGLREEEIETLLSSLAADQLAAIPSAHIASLLAALPDEEMARLVEASKDHDRDRSLMPTHHLNQAFTPRCADCHVEHGPTPVLAETVTDSHCTQCHADLAAVRQPLSQEAGSDSGPFWVSQAGLNIRSLLDGHPEMPIHGVANPAPLSSSRLAPGGKDAAQIRLNHQEHFDRGIACARCHEPDAAGLGMQPIDYKRHCSECHLVEMVVDLSLWEEESDDDEEEEGFDDDEEFDDEDEEFDDEDDEFGDEDDEFGDEDGGSGSKKGPLDIDLTPTHGIQPPVVRELLDRAVRQHATAQGVTVDVDAVVEERLEKLFGDRTRKSPTASCALCHADDTGSLPAPIAPRIPTDWMPNSQFDHETHRITSCTECHVLAKTSKLTTDVLIPKILTDTRPEGQASAVCLDCHRPEGARYGCMECHLYHDRGTDLSNPELRDVLPFDETRRNFDGSIPLEKLRGH